MAFLNGRHFVTPQDVKSVAMDVLRHRVSVTYEAEAENVTSENVIEKILEHFAGALKRCSRQMADEKKSAKAMRSGMRELEIRTRRMVDDSMAGAYHSVFKGRGMDFDEVREYSPGDEVRTIDWNVTARAGRAFVKKFTEERELTHLPAWSTSALREISAPATLAKRDLAAEVASVLAFSAIRNSDKVGLILYTDRIERYLPPKKGRRHVLRVVRDILYHEPQGIGTDTVKTLDVVNNTAASPRGGIPDFGLRDERRCRTPRARSCAARSAKPTGGTT